MMTHRWDLASRVVHDLPQLTREKSPKYRDDTIVPSHRVKPERETGEPEPRCRNPAATEVGYDDAPTRDAIELANDALEITIAEMVQDL